MIEKHQDLPSISPNKIFNCGIYLPFWKQVTT